RATSYRFCVPSRGSPWFGERSTHAAVPAGGKKKRNATRHVRTDLRLQRLRVHFEQRSEQEGHDGEIQEEPSCRCNALWGERRQQPKLVGLHHLAQIPGRDLSTELTRFAADRAREMREAARLRNSQPHQPHPFRL